MKEALSLALIASLVLMTRPVAAQNSDAERGKTRVTLYFSGSAPVSRPEAASDALHDEITLPPAPTAKAHALPLMDDDTEAASPEAVSRTVRYMTAEEWDAHPGNPARQPDKDR